MNKTPHVIIIGILVLILGFLLFYSQQREMPLQANQVNSQGATVTSAQAAPGSAAAGEHASVPAPGGAGAGTEAHGK